MTAEEHQQAAIAFRKQLEFKIEAAYLILGREPSARELLEMVPGEHTEFT